MRAGFETKQRSRKEGVPDELQYVGVEQICAKPIVSTMSRREAERESSATGVVQSLQSMGALKSPRRKMFSNDVLYE